MAQVAEETFKALDRWLQIGPDEVPSARTYARLRAIVTQLWECNRDQAFVLKGLQDSYAIAKRQARQEELML